ncbi:hypothetical protein Efla_001206 [Eimeria flavescens]
MQKCRRGAPRGPRSGPLLLLRLLLLHPQQVLVPEELSLWDSPKFELVRLKDLLLWGAFELMLPCCSSSYCSGPNSMPAASRPLAAAAAGGVAAAAAATAAGAMRRSLGFPAASLLLLTAAGTAAAEAAAGRPLQDAIVYEEGAAAASRAAAAASSIAAGQGLPAHITAYFSLGGERGYQLRLPVTSAAGGGRPSRGAARRGIVEGAAVSAGATVLCLILFTVLNDLAAAAKAAYLKRRQQAAAKALSLQRHVALAAMRQAAEFLLQLQPEQLQQNAPLHQEQQEDLLAAAAHLEGKLLELGDVLPETVGIGRQLLSRLLQAAGVKTAQQQQRQRGSKRQTEASGEGAAASNLMKSHSSGSPSLLENYLGPREEPPQWLEDVDSWGQPAGDYLEDTAEGEEDPLRDPPAGGSPPWGPSSDPLGSMNLLSSLLAENTDLSNKEALLIVCAINGGPECRGAQRPSSGFAAADAPQLWMSQMTAPDHT